MNNNWIQVSLCALLASNSVSPPPPQKKPQVFNYTLKVVPERAPLSQVVGRLRRGENLVFRLRDSWGKVPLDRIGLERLMVTVFTASALL